MAKIKIKDETQRATNPFASPRPTQDDSKVLKKHKKVAAKQSQPALTLFNLGPDFNQSMIRQGLLSCIDFIEITHHGFGDSRRWFLRIAINDPQTETRFAVLTRYFTTYHDAGAAYLRLLHTLQRLGVVSTGALYELPPVEETATNLGLDTDKNTETASETTTTAAPAPIAVSVETDHTAPVSAPQQTSGSEAEK